MCVALRMAYDLSFCPRSFNNRPFSVFNLVFFHVNIIFMKCHLNSLLFLGKNMILHTLYCIYVVIVMSAA